MIKIESIEAIDPKFLIKYFDDDGFPREQMFQELIELIFWLHAVKEENLCFSDKLPKLKLLDLFPGAARQWQN